MTTTTGWKAVLFLLGRIVIAVFLVGGAVAVAEVAVKALKGVLSLGGAAPAVYYVAYMIASVLVAYFVYRAYVHFVERRTVRQEEHYMIPTADVALSHKPRRV